MKAKSKRFLNYGAFCLALLGATLLMAHPVMAEITRTDGQTDHLSRGTDGQTDPLSRGTDGQTDPLSRGTDGQTDPLSRGTDGQTDPLSQGTDSENDRDAGYKDGLREGRKDAQELSEPKEPDQDQEKFKSLDYCDGYFLGYYRGWDEVRHPVQTWLKDIFNWVYDIFFS
ncbi:hypothetical protein [Streptococcus pyogenes]|uniref:hypothetical protein n=1 Tax=Streptococcus pyogenes TaxID=1314 RepID=UPI0010A136B5|nr:hypothetical protein [Streptococcus pyogenes]VGT99589.1 hypothetical membrane associated protein [Streptococcus pyogenes]